MEGRGRRGLWSCHSAAAKAHSARRHIVQGLLAALGASARLFTFRTHKRVASNVCLCTLVDVVYLRDAHTLHMLDGCAKTKFDVSIMLNRIFLAQVIICSHV